METADIEDIFAGLGAVTVKRLFSGKGVYHQGLIVGAVMDGDILLKGDAETEPQFLAAGAIQWTYQYPDGRTIRMPYWTLPSEALDDPDQRAVWVRLAFAAARRAERRPGRKRTKTGKPHDSP
jgi:DNA transformation protein and related proteins